MTLARLILAQWALHKLPDSRKVLEGLFSDKQLEDYNAKGYNIYYLPNGPAHYDDSVILDGSCIDTFTWVFVDYDCKSGVYASKDVFIEAVAAKNVAPTKIVDSGNGVHVYWKVTDLDAKSYLRFQRRLAALYNTDEAVGQIFQLMRLPGTINTKHENGQVNCELLYDSTQAYSCEELDKLLPQITKADEDYCVQHYNRTYKLDTGAPIDEKLPPKFGALLKSSPEAKDLWAGNTDDRSKADYRLGHLMLANDFTKDEALSVLVNSAKALQRAPTHRATYAQNIVDKIWTFEQQEDIDNELNLSRSVKDILQQSSDDVRKGMPFRCSSIIDNTEHGFRLGQVLGLVAGSGVGKTAFALNMFKWFAEANPSYHHFFVPLEQPAGEIATRWNQLVRSDSMLSDKVHVLSNYDDDGGFRHLSFDDIKEYIKKYQRVTGHKIGCVVIDHIGALKKLNHAGENQELMDICHAMKAFAIQTNTFLVMQSQSSREKAGIGDLELNKDAAYGTVYFESYCDYLVTMWQPLKRCHSQLSCPTITAFKYCKIRHKNQKKDVIQEDVCYWLHFDSDTERLRDLTQDEKISFEYFAKQALNKRKADRKTEIVSYQSVPKTKGDELAQATKH